MALNDGGEIGRLNGEPLVPTPPPPLLELPLLPALPNENPLSLPVGVDSDDEEVEKLPRCSKCSVFNRLITSLFCLSKTAKFRKWNEPNSLGSANLILLLSFFVVVGVILLILEDPGNDNDPESLLLILLFRSRLFCR